MWLPTNEKPFPITEKWLPTTEKPFLLTEMWLPTTEKPFPTDPCFFLNIGIKEFLSNLFLKYAGFIYNYFIKLL